MDLVHWAQQLGLIASGLKKFWGSNVAAITSRLTRSFRKIGPAFVCDIVSKTPLIASRSRILTTVRRGVIALEMDGVSIADKSVKLRDDGQTHEVRVVMGNKPPA